MKNTTSDDPLALEHPRTLGWLGTSALAMGGSNQSLFLIAALFVGQGDISGQGSAAVPLLIVGLLLAWAALPGWTELILMWPNRVGGIAATCGEAFRPYAPVLGNLAGTCYWWGWVPTCGLTAILSASAIHQWYLPSIPVHVLACGLVLAFTGINLCGVRWVARLIIPIAVGSAGLAFLSGLLPIFTGEVDWTRATTFHLTTPFGGSFGELTSLMAGLYLIGFAAPAFEAAACHVGETINPERNVPRAMFASAGMAAVYFVLLPVVWLGALGPDTLGKDLALELGPTFAPLFGASAKAAAVWFMILNMFHGTVQPLAGAARTLSQLAEDGLLPAAFARRSKTDSPWLATLVTAGMSILFLLIGDPVWLIAAANFTYLIGICLPSVAVWLLRHDAPDMHRPYRAPRGTIVLGVLAAVIWTISAVLGFQQFGMPTVLFGLAFAFSGTSLYALRKFQDRRALGLPGIKRSLHLKLTGAMLLVLMLDGAGYLLAVEALPAHIDAAFVTLLEDIFVVVAMLTITVGLVLPGIIGHAAVAVADAADRLARGTVSDFSRAMAALGRGDLDLAHARVDVVPVKVHSRDELGEMASNFNMLQEEIVVAAVGLDGARNGLLAAREALTVSNAALGQRVIDLADALAQRERVEQELRAATRYAEEANRAKSEFLANMSHEIRTPINGILGMTELLLDTKLDDEQQRFAQIAQQSGQVLLGVINDILDSSKIEAGKLEVDPVDTDLRGIVLGVAAMLEPRAREKGLALHTEIAAEVPQCASIDPLRVRQVLLNLVNNAIKFTERGHIAIGLKIAERAHDKLLHFEITDSGIGIDDSTASRLFMPFTQADGSTTRKYGGTGLGLAITKQLVELMGGEITFKSVLRVGSAFWFTLPLTAATDAMRQPPEAPVVGASPRLITGRILVAEDNPVNREIVLANLRSLGIETDAVADGREAVEACRRARYSMVLMDCHMPEMDGFEATRLIRESEALMPDAVSRSRMPIIALTANALVGDRERCLAVGMDDYLSKPFARDDLRMVLQQWQAISAQ